MRRNRDRTPSTSSLLVERDLEARRNRDRTPSTSSLLVERDLEARRNRGRPPSGERRRTVYSARPALHQMAKYRLSF